MSAEIYYFSGTGNSLAVARDIAERIEARLLSIPSVIGRECITTDADVVGVVYPVYHGSIPLILKRFVGKLENSEYVFGVCTYGDSPGMAIEHLGELVRSRGGELAAGFAVHMPYNYITPSPVLRDFLSSFTLREIPVEKQQALFAAAQEKIERIAAFVGAQRWDTFETDAEWVWRLIAALNLKETVGKPVWLKIAGVDDRTELSFLESRQLMDRGFWADEKCIACGTCSRVCPVGNIEMGNNVPVWQHRCEQCFACLQWCPQEALQFRNSSAGRPRYHHPDIKLEDMLNH